MDIYTAQYKYDNIDRLDITVKGQDPLGKAFAPTWEMVRGLISGALLPEQYSKQYGDIIGNVSKESWEELLSFASHRGSITLVCFCKPGAFCHRVLLAKWLDAGGWGEYKGER